MEIDQELRREMIVENYEHPFHKGLKKKKAMLKQILITKVVLIILI